MVYVTHRSGNNSSHKNFHCPPVVINIRVTRIRLSTTSNGGWTDQHSKQAQQLAACHAHHESMDLTSPIQPPGMGHPGLTNSGAVQRRPRFSQVFAEYELGKTQGLGLAAVDNRRAVAMRPVSSQGNSWVSRYGCCCVVGCTIGALQRAQFGA
jgi:hypothetical protein